jgi:uncharacterized protein (TIGR03086 family)
MTPLEMTEQTLEDAQGVVNQVRPDDLGKGSPCSDWDVRALVNHMIGVLAMLTAPARGEQIDFSSQDLDRVGTDPSGAFAGAAAAFVAAWKVPGATERVVKTMFGEQPAEFYLGLATADMLLHSWDLATAIGAPYEMNVEAAERVLAAMQGMLKPEMRGPGKAFAEELPARPDASIQERLVAFSGRQAL